MANVKYEVMPSHVNAKELDVGDFFIRHFNIEGIKTFSLYVVSSNNDTNIRAIKIDDNPVTGDDDISIYLRGDEIVEPVYVDVIVKGYCK